jgi:hypothetical protein
VKHLWLLVDPVELGALPALNLTLLEPEGNLLLAVLDGVGAVAHVAADVKSVVATDGARGGGEGVGGTEDGAAGLDGVTAFPDHGADGAGAHVCGVLEIEQEVVGRENGGGRTYRQLDRGRRACRSSPRSASRGAPWRE